jgi:hypothetical protein
VPADSLLTGLCAAVSFVLPKLYSNTVLLSLNSRSSLRSGDGSYALQSVPEHSSHAHTDISAQSRVRPLARILKLAAHKPAARDAFAVRFPHTERGARASPSLGGICQTNQAIVSTAGDPRRYDALGGHGRA